MSERELINAIKNDDFPIIVKLLGENIDLNKKVPVWEKRRSYSFTLYHHILAYLLNPNTLTSTIDSIYPYLRIKEDINRFINELGDVLIFHYQENPNMIKKNTKDSNFRGIGEIAYKYQTDSLYDCRNLYHLIEINGLEKEELMIYLQGIRPSPICPGSPQYSSKRAALPKTKITAFENTSIPTITPKGLIISKMIDQEDCFCLDYNFGIYINTYIPVIRYGRGIKQGYYGHNVQIKEMPQFTWYYIEPESGVYLYSPKTLITKNKLTAILELIRMSDSFKEMDRLKELAQHEKNKDTIKLMRIQYNNARDRIASELELRDEVLKEFEYQLGVPLGSLEPIFDSIEKQLSQQEKTIIFDTCDLKVTNDLEIIDSINGTVKQLVFAGGLFDRHDQDITRLAKLYNFDVVILTRQSGTYKRLVSECVDLRPRDISYSNLYYIDQ